MGNQWVSTEPVVTLQKDSEGIVHSYPLIVFLRIDAIEPSTAEQQNEHEGFSRVYKQAVIAHIFIRLSAASFYFSNK